jgi:hypothetical protein
LGHFAHWMVTDYTSYEGTETRLLDRACFLQLVSYMVRQLPNAGWLLALVRCGVLGPHECVGRSISYTSVDARMSGDMWTSLANGFNNLMVMSFLCHEHGWEVDGVVEGDDGIFGVDGAMPTEKEFECLGLKIKLDIVDNLRRCGFLHMYWTSDYDMVTDPRKRLLTLSAYSGQSRDCGIKVARALLRGRIFSLAVEFPRCPVLHDLIVRGLDLTSGVNPRYDVDDWWAREKFSNRGLENGLPAWVAISLRRGVTAEARAMVSELWGLTVPQQAHLEGIAKCLSLHEPMCVHRVVELFPEDWVAYDAAYRCDKRGRLLCVPKRVTVPIAHQV